MGTPGKDNVTCSRVVLARDLAIIIPVFVEQREDKNFPTSRVSIAFYVSQFKT